MILICGQRLIMASKNKVYQNLIHIDRHALHLGLLWHLFKIVELNTPVQLSYPRTPDRHKWCSR